MQSFSFFFYSLWAVGVNSGRVRALNLTVPLGSGRVGSGQTISGTGRVRASVLSPCRPICSTSNLNFYLFMRFVHFQFVYRRDSFINLFSDHIFILHKYTRCKNECFMCQVNKCIDLLALKKLI